MKKSVKILCLILLVCTAFLLGWKIMPGIWPNIKEMMVYPIFPQLKPTPAPTQELYHPKSDADLGDPIGKTDSLIYYFYKDYCPWCRQLHPLTSGLPKEIVLADGTKSSVILVCLNKADEEMLQIITEYYDTYNIPEEKRLVPAMVIGDKYLFSAGEIVPELMNALIAGEGLNTRLLNGAERQ